MVADDESFTPYLIAWSIGLIPSIETTLMRLGLYFVRQWLGSSVGIAED